MGNSFSLDFEKHNEVRGREEDKQRQFGGDNMTEEGELAKFGRKTRRGEEIFGQGRTFAATVRQLNELQLDRQRATVRQGKGPQLDRQT